MVPGLGGVVVEVLEILVVITIVVEEEEEAVVKVQVEVELIVLVLLVLPSCNFGRGSSRITSRSSSSSAGRSSNDTSSSSSILRRANGSRSTANSTLASSIATWGPCHWGWGADAQHRTIYFLICTYTRTSRCKAKNITAAMS